MVCCGGPFGFLAFLFNFMLDSDFGTRLRCLHDNIPSWHQNESIYIYFPDST